MAYAINERALARWAQKNLRVLTQEGPRWVFRFHYTGSICVNSGSEFPAQIDLTVEREKDRYRVAEVVIKLDPENTGTLTSCHYPPRQHAAMVARNVAYSGVIGADLEEFLQADHALNPGGCFCSVEHVKHKLLVALQTIRYYYEATECRSA